MKKVLVMIISLMLICTMFFGCGKKADNETNSKNKSGQKGNVEQPEKKDETDNFIDYLKGFVPVNSKFEDGFKSIDFGKGAQIDLNELDMLGTPLSVNVGIDFNNKALDLLISGNTGVETGAIKAVYKDGLYVNFGGDTWTKYDAKELLAGLIDMEALAPVEGEKSIEEFIEAIKGYKGNLAKDAVKIIHETFTWEEKKDEVKVTLTEKTLLATKDALVDLIVNNEGVKDKLTKEDFDKLFEKLMGEIDLENEELEADEPSEEEKVYISLKKTANGVFVDLNGEMNADIVVTDNKITATLSAKDDPVKIMLEAELSANEIKVRFAMDGAEDESENMEIKATVKPLDREIKAPENAAEGDASGLFGGLFNSGFDEDYPEGFDESYFGDWGEFDDLAV